MIKAIRTNNLPTPKFQIGDVVTRQPSPVSTPYLLVVKGINFRFDDTNEAGYFRDSEMYISYGCRTVEGNHWMTFREDQLHKVR